MKNPKHPHLIIVRHGQAEHNVARRFNSNPQSENYTPSLLTQEGVHQAKRVGEELKALGVEARNLALVYSSPLERTKQTTSILLETLGCLADGYLLDERLSERQAYVLEGTIIENFAEQLEEKGEKLASVLERVENFYQELRQPAPQGHVLLVTHGTPALLLTKLATGQDVRFENGDFHICAFGDSGPLMQG